MFGYGVSINFAGKIHSPVHVHKEHSFAIDPFSSGTYGVVGMMHTNRIDWLNNPKKSSIIPMPDKMEQLESIPIGFLALVIYAKLGLNTAQNFYSKSAFNAQKFILKCQKKEIDCEKNYLKKIFT
jgi:L-asparaginase/Glu-tRNA(Gln) amidotransferase subunit D